MHFRRAAEQWWKQMGGTVSSYKLAPHLLGPDFPLSHSRFYSGITHTLIYVIFISNNKDI